MTPNSVANKTLSYLFDHLINIIPSVTIDLGAEYSAHIEGVCDSLDGKWTKTLKTWSLPTDCLVFDNTSGALVVAAVPSGLEASAAASSGAAGLALVVSNSVSGSLSRGQIASICVGVIAGVALLTLGGFFLWRRGWRRTRRSRVMAPPKEVPDGYEAAREEERYDDECEGKGGADDEVRSFVPSPVSSVYGDR